MAVVQVERRERQSENGERFVVERFEVQLRHIPTARCLGAIDEVRKRVGYRGHVAGADVDRDDADARGAMIGTARRLLLPTELSQVIQTKKGVSVSVGDDHRVDALNVMPRQQLNTRFSERFAAINENIVVVVLDENRRVSSAIC